MRGGDGQAPFLAGAEVLPRTAQVFGLQEQALDDRQQRGARWCQARQAFASAHEDLDTQLIFQLTDLAAYAGLRGVQRLGHFGQIETTARGFANRTQLLEIHNHPESARNCIQGERLNWLELMTAVRSEAAGSSWPVRVGALQRDQPWMLSRHRGGRRAGEHPLADQV